MKIALPPKKYLILAAAALVAVAVGAARDGGQPKPSAVVEPRAKDTSGAAPRAVQQADGGATIHLEKLNRPVTEADTVNLFATKSWYVPPPPPPPSKPMPPPPPSAPPLPFTFLGKLQEEPQHLVVFLVKGDRIYTVSAGDVIDGTYRVESITGNTLGLTYLPLNIQQTISIGETS